MTSATRRKLIFSIALPIMMQNIVNHLQIVIDRAFLGQLDTRYLSAIGNVITPYNAIAMFLFSAATGLTVLISQKLGSKKNKEAGEYAEASFIYSTIFSSVMFILWWLFADQLFSLLGASGQIKDDAVRYVKILSFSLIFFGIDVTAVSILQGVGHTRPIMFGGFLKTALNILLGYALIFGHFGFPRMGIEGAAIATVIANFAGMLWVLIAALKWKGLPFRYTAKAILQPSWKDYKETLRVGLPTGFESLLWFVGQLALVKMQNSIDPMAIGVTSLVTSLQLFALFAYLGFARAAVTLVGKSFGEENHQEMIRTGWQCQKLSLLISAAWGLSLFFFGHSMAYIFTKDSAVVDRSTEIIKLAAIFVNVQAVNVAIGGAIRGTGDTKWMLYSQSFGTAFVLITSYILMFKFGLGLFGMYVTLIFDEFFRGAVNFFRFMLGKNPFRGGANWRRQRLVEVCVWIAEEDSGLEKIKHF